MKIKTLIKKQTIGDLDITSFMNLMIVLVPVLLLNMTFSTLKVIDLALPELGERIEATPNDQQNIEVVVNENNLELNFPAGVVLQTFDLKSGAFDQDSFQQYLKQVKSTFRAKEIKKTEITLLMHPKSSYDTLISLMGVVRSYPEVVAASVVQAELFPDVSLGDNSGVSIDG